MAEGGAGAFGFSQEMVSADAAWVNVTHKAPDQTVGGGCVAGRPHGRPTHHEIKLVHFTHKV